MTENKGVHRQLFLIRKVTSDFGTEQEHGPDHESRGGQVNVDMSNSVIGEFSVHLFLIRKRMN